MWQPSAPGRGSPPWFTGLADTHAYYPTAAASSRLHITASLATVVFAPGRRNTQLIAVWPPANLSTTFQPQADPVISVSRL